jgi:glyoxylase-like metal-dependent hydrolase (beta-lactamase superfamily II)
MGKVNCYLLDAGSGFVLVDTGSPANRKELAGELERAGCKPGLLKLIVLTHGDFDHTGNAAWLRAQYGSRIAMHRDDAGMGEQGDMFVNRKPPNILIRKLIPLFTGFGNAERFSPDILVEDGFDLAEYSLEARLYSIPGHSRGSIGLLSADGTLLCGDLLENTKTPALNSLMDNPQEARQSLQKLRSLGARQVLPGHGEPFTLDSIQ